MFTHGKILQAGCLAIMLLMTGGGCKSGGDVSKEALPECKVAKRLLQLNRVSCPFAVRQVNSDPLEFVVEWKVMERGWRDIFASAQMESATRLLLRFHCDSSQVECCTEAVDVIWTGGVPRLGKEPSGWRWRPSTTYVYEELIDGRLYRYRFEAKEMKKPVERIIENAGWHYDSVIQLAGLSI